MLIVLLFFAIAPSVFATAADEKLEISSIFEQLESIEQLLLPPKRLNASSPIDVPAPDSVLLPPDVIAPLEKSIDSIKASMEIWIDKATRKTSITTAGESKAKDGSLGEEEIQPVREKVEKLQRQR
eukprot:GABV01009992.1.p1 GENE.GABV01009992.1~~GABV01009992.1.p1  ORF type:complete len:126 (-),score=26.74 GABV01009992.1:128-505(-)